MHSKLVWRRWLSRLFACAGCIAATATSASAQNVWNSGGVCPPPPCCPPACQTPVTGTPATPTEPGAPAPNPLTEPPSVAPSIGPESSGLALSGSTVAMAAPGYVDFAVPITQFRLRYDSAYNNNRPDRAEFFYGKCGCFTMLPRNNPNFDPNAPGPPLLETRVDYQDIRPYLEYAFSNRFSVFVEAPVRFINPDQNANEVGFSNLLAGFKYAVVACPDQYLTFQFVTSTPTADVDRGLGNELVGLEPGVLWYRQLSDRLAFQSEVRDWIPIGGTDFQGNVLRYGGALSYYLHNGCNFRIAPIGEMVGWTVLSGKEVAVANPGFPNGNSNPRFGIPAVTAVQDAAGDTIVNAKIGVRFGFGPLVGPANMSRSDLYIGYGRALTGDVWYKDIIRAEYALRF